MNTFEFRPHLSPTFQLFVWSSQRSHPQYTWEWPAESVARVQAANDVNRSKSQVSQIDVRCIQISKCHKQVSQQIFGSPADYAWIFLADKLSWAGMVTRGKAYLAGCRMQLDTQPARNENSKPDFSRCHLLLASFQNFQAATVDQGFPFLQILSSEMIGLIGEAVKG